jgi:2-methylcitrate dehydratase PrpD
MKKQSLIAQLAGRILAFDAANIPPDVAVQGKHLLLDAIGCALAVYEEDAFESALAAVQEIGGARHCSLAWDWSKAARAGRSPGTARTNLH